MRPTQRPSQLSGNDGAAEAGAVSRSRVDVDPGSERLQTFEQKISCTFVECQVQERVYEKWAGMI